MKLKNTFLLSIILFFIILNNEKISAQTPGLIYENQGISVLDPNSDGYTSLNTSGFSSDDISESEIPYKPIPVLEFEPDSDPFSGPSCAYNDIVESGSNDPVLIYYDGTNLLFRFRLSGTASNIKSYSILVDSDQKFGFYGSEADPNALEGNLGFEFEIVLKTEIGIALYNVDGQNTAVEIGDAATDRPYTSYGQKSVALTTVCGNNDYFYDFYVPMADLTAAFGINENTPLRFVGVTILNSEAYTGNLFASDIAGTDENYFNDIFKCIPPVTPAGIGSENFDCRTSCPAIQSPVPNGAASVTGTSSEQDGTVITLYKNGTSVGTTTVSGGNWSVTGISPALVFGDEIKATAKDGSRYVSFDDCDIEIVGSACTDAPYSLSVVAPQRGVSGEINAPAGTVISLYNWDGTLYSDANFTNPITTAADNESWQIVYSPANTLPDGNYYVRAQTPGFCESDPAFICVGYTNTSAVPVITTDPVLNSATVIDGTGGISPGDIYIFNGADKIGSTSVSGDPWSVNISPSPEACDNIYAIQTETNKCYAASTSVNVKSSTKYHKPEITGDYCIPAATTVTAITGTSSEDENSVVDVLVNGSSVGTTTVSANGTWELTGLTVNIGDVITARITDGLYCLSESDLSGAVTVTQETSGDAVITGLNWPIIEGDNTVSGSKTNASYVTLYQDGIIIGGPAYSSTGSWYISNLNLNPETQLYAGGILTVTETSGINCESEYTDTVIVQCSAPADNLVLVAGQNEYCENETGEIIVQSSENGVVYTPVLVSDSSVIGYSATGTGNDITLTTYPLAAGTHIITVKAEKLSSVACESFNTNNVFVQINSFPDETLSVSSSATTICRGGSVNITISNAENGITYQLQNAADNSNIGVSAVGNGSDLIISSGLLDASVTIKVNATDYTHPANCSIDLNNTVSITVNGPNINQNVTVDDAVLCQNNPTIVNVTTDNDGYTYQIRKNSDNTAVGSAFIGNGAIHSVSTGNLTSDETFYVEVDDGAGCTVRILDEESVTVNPCLTDIYLQKTVDDNTPDEGQNITFTITATNNGPLNVSNLVVTDNLPTGLTFISAVPSAGTWNNPDWTIGNLNNSSSASLTINASVDAGTSGNVITNTVSNTQYQTDNNSTVDDDNESVTVTSTADLSVTTDGNESGPVNIIYTVTLSAVNNTGSTITFDFNDLLSGTATSGTDYTAVSGGAQISVPDGSNTGSISINVTDDALLESTETVNCQISNPSNPAVNITTAVATANILSDETATADLSVTTDGNESGPVNIVYTVTLSTVNNSGSAITFDFDDLLSGTATSGSDYAAVPGSAQISVANGESSGTYTVSVSDDLFFEATETVIVQIANPSNSAVSITTASATADISDNETATAALSVTTNGDEAGTDILYTVTLSTTNNTGSSITFDFDDLLSGTAISGSDYTAISGTAQIDIADGNNTGTFTVYVIDDALLEITETANFQISNPSNGNVNITTASVSANIFDNDVATADLSVTTDGNESGPVNIVYSVTLSAVNETGSSITFDFDDLLSGTATSGSDYTAVSGGAQISVPDGSNTGNISVIVTDDNLLESTETVNCKISNPSNAAVNITTDNATANIISDETATANLSVTTHGNETGPVDIVYTVSISMINNTGSTITFDFDDLATGTATSGSDYTAVPTSAQISIADGADTGNFIISVIDDTVLELTETINMQISNSSESNVSVSTSDATANISDNDTATADLSVTTDGNESGPVNIVYSVSLSIINGTGSAITFDFVDLATGSATSGSDYTDVSAGAQISVPDGSSTGTFVINVIDDALLETTETVNCQISNSSNSDVTITTNEAVADITDNDTADAVLSVQTNGDEAGPVDIVYIITLDKVNNTGTAITFDFVDLLSGTAVSGTDYTAVGTGKQITIADGSNTGTINIPVTDDNYFESAETVNCQINNPSNSDVLITTGTATAYIYDNENINASLSVTTQGNETGPVDIVYTVTFDKINNTGTAITFDFDDLLTGTASSGTDYSAVPGNAQISVPDNSDTGTYIIQVFSDLLFEDDETVNIQISGSSNPDVNINNNTATATIYDDETVNADLSVTTQGNEAGPVDIVYTVTLSLVNNTGSAINFDFNDLLSGTATSGTDYDAVTTGSQISIPAGSAIGTFTIPVTDDALFETTETVNCQISNPSNSDVTINTNSATADIYDNEIVNADLSVTTQGNEAGPVDIVYTVTLSLINNTGSAINFDFNDLLTGTATSGTDYTAVTTGSQISIPEGSATGTFIIPVTDDALFETTETVNCQISNPSNSNVTINTSSATADIYDDETVNADLSVTTQGNEAGPVDIVYTVNLSLINNTGAAVTFDFNDLLTGTATSGTDYTAIGAGAQIIINNGANTGTITIPVIDDINYEPTETVDAQISNPSNPNITITTAAATANISDDDYADIVLTKTVDNNRPDEGDNIIFTVTVTNNGPHQLTNLVITDALPSGLTFVSAVPSIGSWSDPEWTIGTLNNGDSETITITVTVDNGTAGSDIINIVSNTQIQFDDNTTTDDDSETIFVNDIPVANDDNEITDEDTDLLSDVLTNDTGLSDGGIAVTVITDVSNGTLNLNTDGTYTYYPYPDYHGFDSFVYQVCDLSGDCDQATVSITINSVNDFPVAQDDNININEDTELNIIAVLEDNGNGADYFGGDGPGTGSVELLSETENGILIFNDNGTPDNPTDDYFIYTPEKNYYGSDAFEYEICDIDGDCDQAVVNITVIDDGILFVPKIFTPNGDGVNDYFVIEGLKAYPENSILIFNRWGDKVFEAAPYNNDWDGTSNFGITIGGRDLPEGTYFYILKRDNKQKNVKGYIYLKR